MVQLRFLRLKRVLECQRLTVFKVGQSSELKVSRLSWIRSRFWLRVLWYWNRNRVGDFEISWESKRWRADEFRVVKQRVRTGYRFHEDVERVFFGFGVAV